MLHNIDRLIADLEAMGVSYIIPPDATITVDLPSNAVLESVRQMGASVAWYQKEKAWGKVLSGGSWAEWLTDPITATPVRSLGLRSGVVRKYGPVALFLIVAVLFAKYVNFTPVLSASASTGYPTHLSTPTDAATPIVIQNAEQVCGQGAKALEVVQTGENTYALSGTLAEIYPNETGETTYFIAEHDTVKPGAGTIVWLMNGQGNGATEYDKMTALDPGSLTTNKPCTGQTCSALWNTTLSWANSFRNDRLYGDGKDPRYLKNVPAALFTAFRSWITDVGKAWNNNTPIPRCVRVTALEEMAQISKQDIDGLKGTKAVSGSAPLSSPKNQPTSEPLIVTATPKPDYAGSNQPAFDKYAQIVGVPAAQSAFTVNGGQQCYAEITANWPDFTTASATNELLRTMGPSGFTIQPVNGGYEVRSLDKDENGLSACIETLNIQTQYESGTWRIGSSGRVATIHWTESYPGDAREIQSGGTWIWPVYDDTRPTAIPTQAAPQTQYVGISELGAWMSSHQISELTSQVCPPEPLGGQIALTNDVVVDFGSDAAAGLRYSYSGCTAVGTLHFTTYDPGHPDEQVRYMGAQSIWVYPMTKAQYAPSPTPGGPTYPADGSHISLDDLLKYMAGLGQNDANPLCDQYSDGVIPGWPNNVMVNVNVVSYYVDFTPIAGNSAATLCHSVYNTSTGTWTWGRSLHIQKYAPSTTQQNDWGPWLNWSGWYFAPFK